MAAGRGRGFGRGGGNGERERCGGWMEYGKVGRREERRIVK